eukprot:scaffold30991_cov84-Isochrysis_galbana.AAC.1
MVSLRGVALQRRPSDADPGLASQSAAASRVGTQSGSRMQPTSAAPTSTSECMGLPGACRARSAKSRDVVQRTCFGGPAVRPLLAGSCSMPSVAAMCSTRRSRSSHVVRGAARRLMVALLISGQITSASPGVARMRSLQNVGGLSLPPPPPAPPPSPPPSSQPPPSPRPPPPPPPSPFSPDPSPPPPPRPFQPPM